MKTFDKPRKNTLKENVPLLLAPDPKHIKAYAFRILDDIPKIRDEIVGSFHNEERFMLIGVDFEYVKPPFFVAMNKQVTQFFRMCCKLDDKGFQYIPFAAILLHSASKESKDLCIRFEPEAMKECFIYFIIPDNIKELTSNAIKEACEILKEKINKLSLSEIEVISGMKKDNEIDGGLFSCCKFF